MKRRVSIIGGGLAGLAAAVRLLNLGEENPQTALEIHLFEAAKHFGGRAASYVFSEEGVLLDNAQHITMNCCGNMLEFLRRTNLLRFWKLQREMTFSVRQPYVPGASLERYSFRNSRFLPRPLHLLPSLFGLKYLTLTERFQLLGVLRQIQCSSPAPGLPLREWLEDLCCPERVMALFFEPVILSAFSDQLENVSAHMAQLVFTQMLLENRDAWHMWIPQKPLREIFDAELSPFLEKQGVFLHRNTRVHRVFRNHLTFFESPLTCSSESPQMCSSESPRTFPSEYPSELHSELQSVFPSDAVILAVPWWTAGTVMPELVERKTFQPDIYEPRTIAAIHIWTERPLFPEENRVFPCETIQWIFRPPYGSGSRGVYHQALLSDSDRCCSPDLASLERVAHAELGMLFPDARIQHLRAVRTPASVYSCNTWMEHSRPTFLTPFRSVFLAGDWTATGLPATMEGAVKSGVTAAEETFFFLQNLQETSVKRS